MSEDSPFSPKTPPSTPFVSTAPMDPTSIPSIQLPKESPLITGMAAALSASIEDLQISSSSYSRTWVMADDDDIPPLVAETVPFVPVDSPEDSPVDSADSPADTADTADTADSPVDTAETTTTSDGTSDYTWSDVPSDSDEEDSRIPPRPWEGLPYSLVILLFAYLFTQSIGLWTGRILL